MTTLDSRDLNRRLNELNDLRDALKESQETLASLDRETATPEELEEAENADASLPFPE